MGNRRRLVVAAVCGAIAILVSACATEICGETFRQIYRESMEKYASLPGNKAIYVNLQDHCLSWVSDAPSPQTAQRGARINCEVEARARGVDPGHCILVALNGRQFWHPTEAELGP
jgi:hypothetical protein